MPEEHFIHSTLRNRAARMAEQVRENWKQRQRIESYAISWPSETIQTDDGTPISHTVLMRLPEELSESQKFAALQMIVTRTKAHGLVLIEHKNHELRVLFETHHGARAWLTPLERHGDVLVPGKTRVRDNAECLGLLWRPRRGES